MESFLEVLKLAANCLYDFPEDGGGFFLFGQTADDVLTGDNANEAVQIIHYGDKVVADDRVQQLADGGGDTDGGIFPENIPDVEALKLLHGAGITLIGKQPPEKVSFTDGAYVLALAVDDGYSAAAVVPEFFQPLAHGVVVVQIGDAMLRCQKVSNVHSDASFLMAGGPGRLGLVGIGCISIIYRKGLDNW